MLFAALFSAYIFLRTGPAPGDWYTGVEFGLSVPLATFNTVVLIRPPSRW